MLPELSPLHGFVGIKYNNGCGQCSAARNPEYKVMFCEVLYETTFLFLFPFTGTMGLNYGLHKALFQGISCSWKKQSNRNHKIRLCYLLCSSHIREKDFLCLLLNDWSQEMYGYYWESKTVFLNLIFPGGYLFFYFYYRWISTCIKWNSEKFPAVCWAKIWAFVG